LGNDYSSYLKESIIKTLVGNLVSYLHVMHVSCFKIDKHISKFIQEQELFFFFLPLVSFQSFSLKSPKQFAQDDTHCIFHSLQLACINQSLPFCMNTLKHIFFLQVLSFNI